MREITGAGWPAADAGSEMAFIKSTAQARIPRARRLAADKRFRNFEMFIAGCCKEPRL